jgi:hypothetical protein
MGYYCFNLPGPWATIFAWATISINTVIPLSVQIHLAEIYAQIKQKMSTVTARQLSTAKEDTGFRGPVVHGLPRFSLLSFRPKHMFIALWPPGLLVCIAFSLAFDVPLFILFRYKNATSSVALTAIHSFEAAITRQAEFFDRYDVLFETEKENVYLKHSIIYSW